MESYTKIENMKLHLGCGPHLLPGWENIDMVHQEGIVYCDLREPFPYPENSVDYIYNEHFLEHLTEEDGVKLLSKCLGVLKVGGVLRISVPDMEQLVADYHNKGPLFEKHKSIGIHFKTRCQMVNTGFRGWEHLYLYDEEDLSGKLRQVGFSKVVRASWHESEHPELQKLESRGFMNELFLEATK